MARKYRGYILRSDLTDHLYKNDPLTIQERFNLPDGETTFCVIGEMADGLKVYCLSEDFERFGCRPDGSCVQFVRAWKSRDCFVVNAVD